MIFKLLLVFLKRSLDNVSVDWSAKITPSCDCSVIVTFYQARPKPVGRIAKIFFPRAKFTRQLFFPSSALLSAGNLVNIRSTQKLSWIPLFHVRGRRMPSFWLTGTTRFDSVDIICQIWPIRGYTRSWPWYTGTGRLKEWLQAPPLQFPPVLFSSSRSLNSAGPTISEPGTGYILRPFKVSCTSFGSRESRPW